jgi:hypothetical protein
MYPSASEIKDGKGDKLSQELHHCGVRCQYHCVVTLSQKFASMIVSLRESSFEMI